MNDPSSPSRGEAAMHRGKNPPARADDESRTSYGGATTSQGHQHAVHGTGGVTPRGGRSNPRTSPRGVPVMGFGQTVNRGGDRRGGSTLRDRFGGHGGREGERGHEREYIGGHFADDSKERRGRRRGEARRSRLGWLCVVMAMWTFGPFVHKIIQGFGKVYVRRWFYPIERPDRCAGNSPAPARLVDNSPLPGLLPADMTNLPGLRPQKLKVGLLSLCDGGVEAICAESMANKQAYADLHGYDLIVDLDVVDKNRPTSWSKLLAMRKYLPDYDLLLYVDIDTIIMNPEKRLEDIVDYDYDQILAADKNGLNCGVWMVRNTPWMLWFIDEMWAQDQLVAPKTWNMLFKYEQRAFHYLYQSQIWRKVVKGDAYPKSNTVRARTKVVNACVFNSQPAFYKDSDLLVHLAGLKGTVKCMWFRYYYKISLQRMLTVGDMSSDANLPPPSIWTCLTKRT